ncbi:MAG: fused MFS/spermidine synthase [Deltaproteobacteria bacterium]|nr:fused MFS/spermidine synthase [Deltaproteobacteria bacterium]
MPNPRRAPLGALCAALALFILAVPQPAASDQVLIAKRESVYNNIYIFKEGPIVTMTFGHNRALYTETVYDTRDELALPSRYTRYMTTVLAYAGEVDRVLEIGFGGGRTAWYLHRTMPDLEVTSVELDPEVFELAKRHFGVRLERNFNVSIEDGRRYVMRRRTQWPVILIDAYRSAFVPFHLLTTEFYKLVKTRVRPGGAVAQNVEPNTMMFDAALVTIGKVFDHVDLYDAGGNVVMIAYDGPRREPALLASTAARLDQAFGFKYPLSEMVTQRRIVERLPDTAVLTDDFAPVESLRAIKQHNRKLDEFLKGKW